MALLTLTSLFPFVIANFIFIWFSIVLNDILCPKKRQTSYFSLYNKLKINLFRALALGLVYGFLEVHIAVNLPGIVYRLIYVLLLAAPFLNSNVYYFLADSLFAEFVQDTSFWVFDWKMPFSWAWYYPVIKVLGVSLPVDDLIALPIIIILYWLAHKKQEAKNAVTL